MKITLSGFQLWAVCAGTSFAVVFGSMQITQYLAVRKAKKAMEQAIESYDKAMKSQADESERIASDAADSRKKAADVYAEFSRKYAESERVDMMKLRNKSGRALKPYSKTNSVYIRQ